MAKPMRHGSHALHTLAGVTGGAATITFKWATDEICSPYELLLSCISKTADNSGYHVCHPAPQ